MFQWITHNKEWVFSGAGVTIISVVVWLIRHFSHRSKQPLVTVSPALAPVPGHEPIDLISFTIQNCTDRPLYLGNVLIELHSGQTLYFDRDGITGERQQKRKLDAGDAFSFRISKEQFLSVGVAPSQCNNIHIANVAGGVFRPKADDFPKVLACILSH